MSQLQKLRARRKRIWQLVFRHARRTGLTEHEVWNHLRRKTGMDMYVRYMTLEEIGQAANELGTLPGKPKEKQ
jgi:hypothetical protein